MRRILAMIFTVFIILSFTGCRAMKGLRLKNATVNKEITSGKVADKDKESQLQKAGEEKIDDSDLLSIIPADDSGLTFDEEIDIDKEIEEIDKVLEDEDLLEDIPSYIKLP